MSATSRTVSLIRVKRALRDPALLDAGLDLGGHRLGLAGQRGDGAGDLAGRGAGVVGELLHLGGDDRERAARLARPRRLDGGVEGEHVGLAGDRLDRSRRRSGPGSSPRRSRPCGRPAGRRGRSGRRRSGSCPRSRPGPGRACRAPARRARAPRRWNRTTCAWSASSRVVTSSSESSIFEIGGDALVDAGDIAGDVAALDRQRPAIARHLVDRLAVRPLARAARHRVPPAFVLGGNG